eukprot:11184267-Lingulodinium_polyedra.AAC.1
MRTPFLVVAWCARGVRFASRCGGAQSIRPHLCAAFETRYAKMRLNRPSATAAARKPHVCAFHARARKLVRAWSVQVCVLRAATTANGGFDRIFV